VEYAWITGEVEYRRGFGISRHINIEDKMKNLKAECYVWVKMQVGIPVIDGLEFEVECYIKKFIISPIMWRVRAQVYTQANTGD